MTRLNREEPPQDSTLLRTLRPDLIGGSRLPAAFHGLEYGSGEPRVVRTELLGRQRSVPLGEAVVFFAQMTDLQICDYESPGRLEFMEGFGSRQQLRNFLPAWRPQELLVLQACEAIIRTINSCQQSLDTGAKLQVCLSTGDNLDNAQANELEWFIGLMSGARIRPGSGGPELEGVQGSLWHDPGFWHPDRVDDEYKRRWGFPTLPWLLDQARTPFQASGLQPPWISCFGNHDGLVMGNSVPSPAYRELVLGPSKPVALAPGFNPLEHQHLFHCHPELYLTGRQQPVSPDSKRQIVGRREFIEAHLNAQGLPAGHGYSRANLANNSAYSVFDDCPLVRFVLLDTTNMDGYFEGSIGVRQFRWLEQRLIEVSSRYFQSDGSSIQTREVKDKLVVIASHHGLRTLTNERADPDGLEDDQPRVTAPRLRQLLHRFPNVVLWVNGHRHVNEIEPRYTTDGRGAGFWEVSTCAVADWPCQMRLIELTANADGSLSILCTMVDHKAPAQWQSTDDQVLRLASLHRQLAANDPYSGDGQLRPGSLQDRNVELLIPAPFTIC